MQPNSEKREEHIVGAECCVCLCVAGAVGCWELKSINGEDTAVSNYWGS